MVSPLLSLLACFRFRASETWRPCYKSSRPHSHHGDLPSLSSLVSACYEFPIVVPSILAFSIFAITFYLAAVGSSRPPYASTASHELRPCSNQ
jgi:hypothetical protein